MTPSSVKQTSMLRWLLPIAISGVLALGFPLKTRAQSPDQPEKAVDENTPVTSPYGTGSTSGGIATQRDMPEQPLPGLSQPASPSSQAAQSSDENDQGDEQQGEYFSDQDDE